MSLLHAVLMFIHNLLVQARLVLRWETISWFHSQYWTISVSYHPPRSTQPGHPFVFTLSQYQPKDKDSNFNTRKATGTMYNEVMIQE